MAGHADSIGQLFRDEYDRLVHYLLARTRSLAEARDIASQAFKQTLEHHTGSIEQPKAFVYRVASNIATDRARASEIRKRLSLAIDPASVESAAGPENSYVDQQRRDLLRAAIQQLPPRWRMAFMLSACYELPHAEILDRFATVGVEVNERTLRRWIASAFAQCQMALLSAEAVAEVE